MVYKYKKYVHIRNMNIDKNVNCRFLAEYDLDDGNDSKVALVIMKNPSKADYNVSDQTINNVLEYMHEFQYSKVYIMNLIPIYGTDSNSIKDDLLKREDILRKNDKMIMDIADKVSKIFVAWGGKSGFDKEYYNSRILSVRKYLGEKTLYCYGINRTNNQPIHPGWNQWRKRKSEKDFEVFI